MQKKTYIITYKVYDKNNTVIADGKMKVKNKANELSAKIGLENYLQKKHCNFNRLFISNCELDINFGNAMDIFNDIFNTKF